MSLAWHIEALRRAKKLPKLEKLMAKRRSRRSLRPQTPEQMLAVVKMLNAAFGGSVIEKRKD